MFTRPLRTWEIATATAVAAFVVGGVIGWRYIGRPRAPSPPALPIVNQTPPVAVLPAPSLPSPAPPSPPRIELPEPIVPGPVENLKVDWRAVPLERTPYHVARQMGVDASGLIGAHEYGTPTPQFYQVGSVSGGTYDGAPLLLVFLPCEGMCFQDYDGMLRVVVDAPGKRLLNITAHGVKAAEALAYSGEVRPPGKHVVDHPNLRILDLNAPDRVRIAGSSYELVRSGDFARFRFVTLTEARPIGETVDGRTVYTDDKHWPLLKFPDGTYEQYRMDIPFLTSERIPRVTWSDGTANTAEYTSADVTGCGAVNGYAVRTADELRPDERLTVGGRTSNGELVYVLRNAEGKDIELLYRMYQSASGEYIGGDPRPGADSTQPMTLAAFTATRPLFYWVDPFGRWIAFKRADTAPAVECGKPVMYLYPETETDVRVSVGLRGTLTASEPPHGRAGWFVRAQPDGYVRNYVDGVVYPNLFWEGTGVRYDVPERGFVIVATDADAWLERTLRMIGFSDREQREFREFWVPRMPRAPYLFITFVSQADFDRDAPLRITPAPDVVYRVFMVARGLDAPKDVEPLPLPRIVRKGFTVVEWGGELVR